ncbi:unnamed protein product [Nippostrongylus brasiliensis]|uniref:SH2 domain-containing protein n=1 Tax=Nippostrongylus brasiliensis TaxID=27835 RepID=A0A0N4XCJ9_NIPBR|nr:hypothetical protein Q1695_015058 [Nippostrongylus brasiliensis]VDL62506.1 unnamed protein product [Nippostrongylus brasiliensis]
MSRRRASDVAHDFLRSIFGRFRKDDTKRSLSTGDLVDNYMEIDFTRPTTSTLPAHLDDCDRVPMQFSSSTYPRLLSQHDRKAQKLMRHGSELDNTTGVSIADYNRAQVWFHQDMDSAKADRLLRSAGNEEGSFTISQRCNEYVLSYVHDATVHHIRVGCSVKESGEPKFRLDIDRSFSSLHDLVEYYKKHRTYVLPMKLKRGIARPLRTQNARTRA